MENRIVIFIRLGRRQDRHRCRCCPNQAGILVVELSKALFFRKSDNWLVSIVKVGIILLANHLTIGMQVTMRSGLKLARALLTSSLLTGCAYSFVDPQGNRHIVGLVNLTISPATSEPSAADWVRLRTVGLSLNSTQIASSLDLGYSDSTLAVIRDNSCAVIRSESYAAFSSKGENHAPDQAR